MPKLIELSEINADNFITMLSDMDIAIYENIKGSRIFFNFTDTKLRIKPSKMRNDDINLIDISTNKFYSTCVEYLSSLDTRVKKLCPDDVWFCCEYFYDNNPKDIEYDSIPDSNLVLTSIVRNNKHRLNIEEINEYSRLLNIMPLPIIFYGKLNPKQIELINYFLHTNIKDLEYIFGEDNFTSFFYKILNPSIKSSALMKDSFTENIDKLILAMADGSNISLAILNPLHKKTDKTKESYNDSYSILLLDFLEFIQKIDINRKFISGGNYDEIYIDLLCDLFNSYMEKRCSKIEEYNFQIPPYFMEDKSKVNLSLIRNSFTKELINMDPKFEYMFKIILQSFIKKKHKESGYMDKNTMNIFNTTVETIDKVINRSLRLESDTDLKNTGLIDFEEFYDIKEPNTDATGNIYINKDKEEYTGSNKKKFKK